MLSMKHRAAELIDLLGGTAAVAKLLGIKPPSVSEWRSKGIPDDKLIRLTLAIERESKGAITRQMLFPNCWSDIWPESERVPASEQGA
jgi:DNA-binding transcriptional regulator YdaS (Cro superfamily)